MKRNELRLLALLVGAFLIFTACGLLPTTPASQGDPAALHTQAAQTVAAQLTQQAYDNLAAQLTQIASGSQATPTVLIPQTGSTPPATPTPTQAPPSPTPSPSPTPPPPSPTPQPCNRAEFVEDVTVGDGTVFNPGALFTKVWRLRNTGACTWNTSYSLVFVSGNQMDGRSSVSLPANVRPGEVVDVSVDLRAPGQSGAHRGEWMLRSAEGLLFGIGKGADRAFWVEIEVIAPVVNNRYSYDFAANYCSAGWRSSTGRLDCPGGSDSPDGSVILLDRPELENGRIEDELTLWTRPDTSLEGWISGDYPAYQVKSGDHFLADVGCLAESKHCDVIFSLSYRIDGGTIRNLGTWREAYDGGVTRIDLDLSTLAGQPVQFILSVENWGKPEAANAFWLAPSIRSLGTGLEWTPAAQAARQKVAVALGLDPLTIAFKSVWAAEWTDSCLGVHLPDQVCAPAVVSGLRIVMTAGNREYEAHTNADGSVILWFEL